MLESIRSLSNVDGSWNMEKVGAYDRSPIGIEYIDTVGSNGRLIEALVLFYDATGDTLAFELADRFARHHFERSTQEDGGFNSASNAHHTHSYLGMLRGLLLFGELTRQDVYIERVRKTFAVTVKTMVKRSGYTSHDIGEERRGETSSGGDAAQIALWLARLGHTQYLDDAERIMRARLLPSQLLESPKLTPKGTGDDRYADLDRRIIGGFGGMHRGPHDGKMNVTDVTAACLHTVIDIYNHVVDKKGPLTFVNFHFDYEDDDVLIVSRRDEVGRLMIQPRRPTDLMIRIPGFATKIEIDAAGGALPPPRIGDFTFAPAVGSEGLTMEYDLPRNRFVERTNNVDYTFEMRGDEVTSIVPWDSFYPFYPNGCS